MANIPVANIYWHALREIKSELHRPDLNLYWTFFRYDPISDWEWTVDAAPAEPGQGSNWWRGSRGSEEGCGV